MTRLKEKKRRIIDAAVRQSIKQYGKTYKMLAEDKMVEEKRRIRCKCGKLMKRVGPYQYKCSCWPEVGVMVA